MREEISKTAGVTAAPVAARSRLQRARIRSAWLFLFPTLLALCVVAAWPLLRTFYYSFTDATLFQLSHYHFVGFQNYLVKSGKSWYGLLADPTWWQAVKNTVIFTVISVSIETVLGMIVALILNASFYGRGVVRAAILVPWAIPTVVSSEMWSWMLDGQLGIINAILEKLHIISEPLAWTADPHLVMASIIMVDVWKATPFMALLLLAGLQMLPGDCYEAARVDGIHPVKVFFRVTLPLIKPALMVALIFRILDALRVFDIVYVMTGYTPQTITMSVYAQQQLVSFRDVGYGSAASTLVFFFIALFVVAFIYVGRVRLTDQT